MLIQIKNWMNGNLIYECECKNIKEAVESAVKNKVNLRGSNLRGSDLSYSDLSYSDLSYSDLLGSDLRSSNLSYSNLRSSDLRGSNLRGSDLRSSDLRGSDLRYSDLRGSDLRSSDLSYSNLRSSDLRGSNLSYSDLSYSNLSGSNLEKKYCYLSISPIGSENGCLWTMKNAEGILMYNRGCFAGTKEQFLEAISKKHGGTEYEKKYIAAVNFIESQISS